MIRRIYLELRRRVEAFVKYTGTFGLLLNPASLTHITPEDTSVYLMRFSFIYDDCPKFPEIISHQLSPFTLPWLQNIHPWR